MSVSASVSVSPLFRSFWMGGFESATHINRLGKRVDMVADTQHDVQATGDYALLRGLGLRAARDAARWHLIEQRRGQYDFASLTPLADAARANGVQVIWNLCHYGWPNDVDVFSPAFPDRFARYCAAVARYFAAQSDDVPWYTPMNETSFLAWAGGDVAYMNPLVTRRGGALKRQLVRATIAAMDAIWAVDRSARFAQIEPLIHVVPPRNRPELATKAATALREGQFEVWDMLAGRDMPSLGGHPRYLDVVGVNFYHDNQWEFEGERIDYWAEPRDPRYMPLHRLLAEVWSRYHRPLFIAETGHFQERRAQWLRDITEETRLALQNGVPVGGVCLYPLINRRDWQNEDHLHESGLFDLDFAPAGTAVRVLNADYAAQLRRSQAILSHETPPPQFPLTGAVQFVRGD